MPPKKTSPYMVYLQSVRPKYEKQMGKKLSTDELNQIIGKSGEWARLTPEERSQYKGSVKKKPLMDSYGVPLAHHEHQKEKTEEDKTVRTRTLVNMIDMYKAANALQNAKFTIAACSEYVTTISGDIVPAEIALLRFSLAEGIIDTHNVIIAPRIPAGYRFDCIQVSEQTHNLPIDEGPGLTDMYQVVTDLIKFFDDEKDISESMGFKVFTLQSMMKKTHAMLMNLMDYEPTVFELEELYVQLALAICPDTRAAGGLALAQGELQQPVLDFHPKLACEWHETESPNSVNWCMLNCCRRWCYLLMCGLRLNETMGVKLIQGRHVPHAMPLMDTVAYVPATNIMFPSNAELKNDVVAAETNEQRQPQVLSGAMAKLQIQEPQKMQPQQQQVRNKPRGHAGSAPAVPPQRMQFPGKVAQAAAVETEEPEEEEEEEDVREIAGLVIPTMEYAGVGRGRVIRHTS